MRAPESSNESDQQLAQHELNAIVDNNGIVEMAKLFGLTEIPTDQHDRLAAYQTIATEHWDFRKGAERQSTDWDDELLDDPESEQYKTIFEGADELGLVHDSEPRNKNPDYLVILGGANQAPLDRLRYAMEKLGSFGHAVYLGSSRKVSDTEREKAKDYAPDAQTEFDLGCGAFETLLHAQPSTEYKIQKDGDTWLTRLYEYDQDGETKYAFALSTPQRIGVRRATTYDNYSFFADRAELAKEPGKTVVAVTTGFYTAAQHLPGVQELTLQYDTELETIGHSAEYSGVTRKPSQLLQETKATIDAALRLEAAINENADVQ